MGEPRPPIIVDLTWQGELRFTATSGEATIVLDSEGAAGPSPMQALAFALAGCMAMDVVHILVKGRSTIEKMAVHLSGLRAEEHPRRFTSIEAHFLLMGDIARESVERAIALSREKYCSVLLSMHPDIEFKTRFEVTRLNTTPPRPPPPSEQSS